MNQESEVLIEERERVAMRDGHQRQPKRKRWEKVKSVTFEQQVYDTKRIRKLKKHRCTFFFKFLVAVLCKMLLNVLFFFIVNIT